MAGYRVVSAYSLGGSNVFRSPVLIGSSLWLLKQGGAAGQQFYEIDTVTMTGLSVGGGDGLTRVRMAYDGTNFWTTTSINRFYRNVVAGFASTFFTGNIIQYRNGRGVCFDGTDLFVTRNDTPFTLIKVSQSTGAQLSTLTFGSQMGELISSDGSIWAPLVNSASVQRVDSATMTATSIAVGTGPFGVVAGGGSIWVNNQNGPSVSRIDPSTNTVSATITVPGTQNDDVIGFFDDKCWVKGNASGGRLYSIDLANNIVDELPSGTTTGFISDGSFLYVVRATSVDKIGKAGGIFTDGAAHL
jgi:YVTN family beta-propeller protein